MTRLHQFMMISSVALASATAQDIPFTVKLTSPLSTSTNHKGDPVYAQVMSPPQFAGDTVSGHITELKQGNKIKGEAVLNFNFDTLQHGGAPVQIASSITSIMNSKGQTDVDEEGRVIKKTNNVGKAAAGTGLGAAIGGIAGGWKGAGIGAAAGAVGSIVLIEVAASGPKVEFAPGAQFGLSVKSRGGPDLASLPVNAPGSAPAPPPAPTPSASAPTPLQQINGANGAGTSPSAGPAPAAGASGDQPQFSTVRIDFVPGEKTVFFDDFSDMAQDEPPPHWRLRGNPIELRVGPSMRELYAGKDVELTSQKFAGPANFTFELEWTGQGETNWRFLDKDNNEVMHAKVRGEPDNVTAHMEVDCNGTLGDGGIQVPNLNNQPVKFALWVQQGRVRAYMNGQRLLDVNQVDVKPFDHIFTTLAAYRPNGLRSIRVAESAPDFSQTISSTGKYVTHGILFDTDSARLKPESAPMLKSVVAGLTKNPNLKLEIDGYTDSVGDANHNLDLSKRRAQAVKDVLVSQFGVDANRLTTNGFGADKPIGSNDTPDGRANNRRVEFVKQ